MLGIDVSSDVMDVPNAVFARLRPFLEMRQEEPGRDGVMHTRGDIGDTCRLSVCELLLFEPVPGLDAEKLIAEGNSCSVDQVGVVGGRRRAKGEQELDVGGVGMPAEGLW